MARRKKLKMSAVSVMARELAARRWQDVPKKARLAHSEKMTEARHPHPTDEPVLDLDGLVSTFGRPRHFFRRAILEGRLPAKTTGQGTKRWVAVTAAAAFLQAHDAVRALKKVEKS